jgi:hypothetical protein
MRGRSIELTSITLLRKVTIKVEYLLKEKKIKRLLHKDMEDSLK